MTLATMGGLFSCFSPTSPPFNLFPPLTKSQTTVILRGQEKASPTTNLPNIHRRCWGRELQGPLSLCGCHWVSTGGQGSRGGTARDLPAFWVTAPCLVHGQTGQASSLVPGPTHPGKPRFHVPQLLLGPDSNAKHACRTPKCNQEHT